MKVMVTGSRDWPPDEWPRIYDVLDGVLELAAERGEPLTVMHGAAAGPDSWADEWASDVWGMVEAKPFPPDKTRPSPQRFHERNDRMLDEAELVIAFWDGKSRGTKSVIDKAIKRDLAFEVYSPAGVYVEV